MKEALNKQDKLFNILRELGDVVLAFSGGVDSTYLLWAALRTLGCEKVLAVTEASPIYPAEEAEEAKRIAGQLGVRHIVLNFEDIPETVRANPADRCYHCKKELFLHLKEIAEKEGFKHILDAANADDVGDYRPGLRAARELGVVSPLMDAGLGKEEIRYLSKIAGLPTWDKPSSACLASRFPYGTQIREDILKMVEKAEAFIKGQGAHYVRVRYHNSIARVEVDGDSIDRIVSMRDEIVKYLKSLGFIYITLDLEGYRTGSLNEVLAQDDENTLA